MTTQHSLKPCASPKDGIARDYFKFPNQVVDALMHHVSGAQFKTFVCIWRMSFGFRRSEFPMSLRELAVKAGVGRDTGLHALQFWERTGLIEKTTKLDGRSATVFRLASIESVLSGLNRLADKSYQLTNSTNAGRKNRVQLVGWFDPSKDSSQKQKNTTPSEDPIQLTSNPASASVEPLPPRRPRIPDGATLPDSDPWEIVKRELKRTMNPQSYSTWVAATGLAYVREDTLFVRVPNKEWAYMREQFGAAIENAINALALPYSGFDLDYSVPFDDLC